MLNTTFKLPADLFYLYLTVSLQSLESTQRVKDAKEVSWHLLLSCSAAERRQLRAGLFFFIKQASCLLGVSHLTGRLQKDASPFLKEAPNLGQPAGGWTSNWGTHKVRRNHFRTQHRRYGWGKERPDQQHPQDQHDGCPAGVASRTQLGIQAGDTEAA